MSDDLLKRDQLLIEYIKAGRLVVENNRIFNSKTSRFLGENSNRYNPLIQFYMNGVKFVYTMSRILWLANKGPIPANSVPIIKDKNKPVTVDNLVLITKSEFSSHAARNVLPKKGEAATLAKFTNEWVLELRREFVKNPYVIQHRAKEMKIDRKTLSNLLTGVSFKDVAEPVNTRLFVRNNNVGRKRKPKTSANVNSAIVKTKSVVEPPVVDNKSVKNLDKPKTVPVKVIVKENIDAITASKTKQHRLFLLKMAGRRLEQRQGKHLTPFKRFATYHLYSLGYSLEAIKDIVPDIFDQQLLDKIINEYPCDRYQQDREYFITMYGEDSKMLTDIKIKEGFKNGRFK